MATSHKLLLCRRHGHAEAGARNVVDRLRDVRQARKVVIARLGRILFERVEVILFALEVIILVVAERLAIRAGLVCATMSDTFVRSLFLVGGYMEQLTGPDCPSAKKPCCTEGKRMVVLVCGYARV